MVWSFLQTLAILTKALAVVSALYMENESGEPAAYNGKALFFFKAKLMLNRGNRLFSKIHHLAFVKWYQFVNQDHAADTKSGLPAVNKHF